MTDASATVDSEALVVRDAAMAECLRRARLIAPGTAPVMIAGECGTGKETMAHHLHRLSGREDETFVMLSCTALPETVLDEALFGHESGTLAGGTLLLCEVGEMELPLQAKLLRAVQLQERDRTLGTMPVRIIATTSRDLAEDVRLGRFRADLFFRLNVITLNLPPLRERPADVPALADHFAAGFARLHNTHPRTVSPAALDRLLRHSWPGNVRELRNVMHRAVLSETGPSITPQSLDIDPRAPALPTLAQDRPGPVPTTGRTIEAVEKDMILATLRQCQGHRSHAATMLGISIRTLRNKLHEYERDGTPIPRAVIIGVS